MIVYAKLQMTIYDLQYTVIVILSKTKTWAKKKK